MICMQAREHHAHKPRTQRATSPEAVISDHHVTDPSIIRAVPPQALQPYTLPPQPDSAAPEAVHSSSRTHKPRSGPTHSRTSSKRNVLRRQDRFAQAGKLLLGIATGIVGALGLVAAVRAVTGDNHRNKALDKWSL